jgi:UDP-3-O-[3-hydroxymyristoyl] glucosamine N-acyltransferase
VATGDSSNDTAGPAPGQGRAYRLRELAEHVAGELEGDGETRIERVAPLDKAGPRALSFLTSPRYRRHLRTTAASAVILGPDDREDCPVAAIVVGNPHLAFARIAALLHPKPTPRAGVHPSAWVSPASNVHPSASVGPQAVIEQGAVVGPRTQVGPGCVIGPGVQIGADCHLVASVTICSGTHIGDRVLIQPGAVIGAEGFGIANDHGTWVRVPQLGGVRIGDDVEIGANTTVDCGALEDTVIEEGVKLDNQIQVGHNVRIGAHTAIAGCVGISGSAKIGRYCMIGGGTGIAGHLTICDGVQVTGMSMITRSISEPGVYSSGSPLQPNQQWHKNFIRMKQLDDMARRIKALEQKLKAQC